MRRQVSSSPLAALSHVLRASEHKGPVARLVTPAPATSKIPGLVAEAFAEINRTRRPHTKLPTTASKIRQEIKAKRIEVDRETGSIARDGVVVYAGRVPASMIDDLEEKAAQQS